MRYLLCIMCCILALKSFGQEKGQFYKIYPRDTLTYIPKLVKSDPKKGLVGISKTVPPLSVTERKKNFYKATLIQNEKNGDSIKVVFWSIPFKDIGILPTYVRSVDEDAYHYILNKRKSLKQPPLRYKIFYYKRYEVGVATMPFKYRPGYNIDSSGKTLRVPNDVSTGINVGLYVGHKWGQTLFYNDVKKTHDRWGVMASIFTGPVAIKVSTNNVSDKIKRETNELGWQIGGGIWISHGNIDVGTFLGTDIPLTGAARQWDYAYKPWIGFGLGYKLGIFDLKKG